MGWRVPNRLFIAEGALWAGPDRIAAVSEIEQALVIPPPRPVVRVIAGTTRFELPVERHLNARETVDALGLGPSRAPLRFRWRSWRLALVHGGPFQPRVEIGCDGVFVVNAEGSFFVPYGIVRSVSTEGMRLENDDLVTLGDRIGPRNPHDADQDDALVVLAVERIEHALARPHPTVSAALIEHAHRRIAAAAHPTIRPDVREALEGLVRKTPSDEEQ